MSIGASEHRTFVRAKARLAGQKSQEHSFVRRNAVFTGHIAMYRWWHFLAESAARALTIPDVPASDLPVLIHSRWLLPGPPQHLPPPGVSRFRHFRCYLNHQAAPHGSLRHPPLPGVSRFRRFRAYPDRPHALHGSLRHPSLPGVSRFPRFRCYLNSPPALHGSLPHPPLPGVSRSGISAATCTLHHRSAHSWNIRRPVEHRRAHQAPFYARGLSEIIAVSENAPGAHGAGPAGVDGADGHRKAQAGTGAVRLSDRSSEDEDSTGGCLREGWEPGRDDVDLSGRAGDGIGWNR